ncbi:hypothetical protein CBE01nite_08170 [Clostridium beijerinckii]|jgi:hypothetical protein|nr:hypothetical protein CBE01nite_08170 [Clostridium beijerinckii]
MDTTSYLDIPSEVFLVLRNIYVFYFGWLPLHFKFVTIPLNCYDLEYIWILGYFYVFIKIIPKDF